MAPWMATACVLLCLLFVLRRVARRRGRAPGAPWGGAERNPARLIQGLLVTVAIVVTLGGLSHMRQTVRIDMPRLPGWHNLKTQRVTLHVPETPAVAPVVRTRVEAGTRHAWEAAEGYDHGPSERAAPGTIVVTREHGRRSVLIETSRGGIEHRRWNQRGGFIQTFIIAGALAAFLYLAYIFLDAGTRGHFTWTLRATAVLAFGALCAALSALRDGQ